MPCGVLTYIEVKRMTKTTFKIKREAMEGYYFKILTYEVIFGG